MSHRAYNRFANILMLVAIGSALLFDSGKLPHVVVGTVGILTGLVAVALYFWHQYHSNEKKKESRAREEVSATDVMVIEQNPSKEVAPELRLSFEDIVSARQIRWPVRVRDPWQIALQTKFHTDDVLEAYRRIAAEKWLAHYAENYARHLRWSVAKGGSRALMQPEVELSPNEVATCAIEIMRNIAISDDLNGNWEYSFGPKGLRVSLKKVHPVRPVVSQEDFDFGNVSSLVQ